MNAPDRFLLMPDIQSTPDQRLVAIDRVGVKSIRHPVRLVRLDGSTTSSVAVFDMYVGLPHDQKGTHMSRFLELLQRHGHRPLDAGGMRVLMDAMLRRLEATSGHIEARFPYFISKAAPVSRVQSLLDYDVTLSARVDAQGRYRYTIKVVTAVTSLCPCSKEISEYGAHNQRSHITIEAELAQGASLSIEGLVAVAEAQASCEVYGLLKRPDEKYVTERAYDNPKFVEDLVRDVALALHDDLRIAAYTVESENFESIHNHSAYALITRDKSIQE
jgi:GTP cyclohydrolase I